MATSEITRAWKDLDYRYSLSAERLALIPENPAGSVRINGAGLEMGWPETSQSSICSYNCRDTDFIGPSL